MKQWQSEKTLAQNFLVGFALKTGSAAACDSTSSFDKYTSMGKDTLVCNCLKFWQYKYRNDDMKFPLKFFLYA